MDVDLTIAQGLKHVPGDLLAVVEIQAGDADERRHPVRG